MTLTHDIFTEAPKEVIRYFEAKKNRPTFDWRDIAAEEHAFSLTVAKSTGFDILDDIRAATHDAIKDYIPFETFKNQLQPILQKKGWWGKRFVIDPKDGRQELVLLGSPRRLRIIYWANIKTARAAGEWERTLRTKAFLPFLLYTQSIAEKRRIEHQGWVGTILPVDHEWWLTHYPPNGWLCQCGVRQISAREARMKGYNKDTVAPKRHYHSWYNGRAGRTERIPVGIDPGWQTNPGHKRAQNMIGFLSGRLDNMGGNRRRIAVTDIVGSALFHSIQSGLHRYDRHDISRDNRNRGAISAPVAMLSDVLAKTIGAQTKTVWFSVADAEKQLRKRRRHDGTPLLSAKDYAMVQKLIDEGEIYFGGERDLIAVGELQGKMWRAVLRRTIAGFELYLKSFYPVRRAQIQQDRLRQRIK